MDEIQKGIIVALVEGLTEFLPVSSTGHMILVGDIIGFAGDKEKTFSIAIQLGAILSVVVLLWPRFLACIPFGELRGQKLSNALNVILACAPAFVLGFLFHKLIKETLFNPFSVALALIVGGVLMLLVDRSNRVAVTHDMTAITPKKAFLIGIAQCFALWPGFSRSGATILGGLLVGLKRSVAAEFSFVVAVPVMVAATGYDLLKSMHLLHKEDITLFLLGSVVAFVTALLSVKWLMRIVSLYTLAPFAVYRIVLGGIVLVFIW
jgi:undecaprenyl-diphosphatase